MGETIGPVVAKPAIDIDPEEWAAKPVDLIYEAIRWRTEEVRSLGLLLTCGTGTYKLALKQQRLQRELVVLRNCLPPLRVVDGG